MKIGAQSYTIREYCRNEDDFARSMEKVAGIGYRYVQLSAIGPIEPARVRDICDRNGLAIVLTHNPEGDFLQETDRLIEKHLLYGCRYAGLGMLPERYREEGGAERFAADFGPAAEKLKAAGLKLMYHNHALEFERMADGRTMMDHLLSALPADLMGVTADTYWLQYGGMDVCAWLEAHGERLHCVHLKDFAVKGFEIRMAPVGGGNLDFRRILKLLGENGTTEYALVEQDECYGTSPFDCLRQSFEYLK